MENERLDSEEKPHDATAVVGRNKVGRTGGGGAVQRKVDIFDLGGESGLTLGEGKSGKTPGSDFAVARETTKSRKGRWVGAMPIPAIYASSCPRLA